MNKTLNTQSPCCESIVTVSIAEYEAECPTCGQKFLIDDSTLSDVDEGFDPREAADDVIKQSRRADAREHNRKIK